MKAKKIGYKFIFFVIQREDCNVFQLAKDIDPEYCVFKKSC